MTSIPGRSLVRCFSDREREAEAAIASVDSGIREQEGVLARANAVREAAYSRLAAMYLDHSAEVFGPVSDVSRELQSIFDRRIARRAEIDGAADQARAQRAATRAALEAARAASAECDRARDAGRARVAEAMAADEACQRQVADAAARKAAFEEASRALVPLRTECAEKLRDFVADPLFRYLLKSGFGGESYGRSGFSARIDGMVARLVDWERNARNHRILSKLPEFAERRLEALRDRAQAARACVDLAEREIGGRIGLPALDSAAAQAAAEVARLTALAAQIDRDLASLEAERALIDARGDGYLSKAKARIRALLDSDTIVRLRERARATPSEDDDRAVDEIERAEAEIAKARQAVRELRAEREARQAEVVRLREAHREFERRYTGTYDRFTPGVNLDGLLAGYIAGTLTQELLWTSLQGGYVDATPRYAAGGSSWGGDSSSWAGSGSSPSGSFDAGGASAAGASFGGGDPGGGASFGGGDSGGGASFGGGS